MKYKIGVLFGFREDVREERANMVSSILKRRGYNSKLEKKFDEDGESYWTFETEKPLDEPTI
jgi:hypothetical protein